MAVNPLPPQAFTKETLQKAYTWLLTQSPSIKEMASTQDMLISLYLKAQRNGEASLETPSIQNFKQELKSLAGIMGDLQTPPSANTTQTYTSEPAQQTNPSFTTNTATSKTVSVTVNTSTSAQNLIAQLDPGSMQAVQDVKSTLNLSSEVEALRALIALGHKQFRKIHT